MLPGMPKQRVKRLGDARCRLRWMQSCGVKWGVMWCNAVGLWGSAAKEQFQFSFRGESQEFDQSPFNPLKNPQQMGANHQLVDTQHLKIDLTHQVG